MSLTTTPRNYLITGAARGIGRGLSRLLHEKGHNVFLLDNDKAELGNTARSLMTGPNPKEDIGLAIGDLALPADIEYVFQIIRHHFNGRVDVLINNAALTTGAGAASVETMPLDLWNKSLAVNLTAPMLMSQHCIPMLRKSPENPAGGCIINISSTRASMSEPSNEAYSTTKAGLLGLTQSMAVSLGPKGIRVNAILPGWINVLNECAAADKTGAKWEDGLSKEDHAWHLNGRVGKVEDVLRAVEYLAEAEFVTGAEMVVDGGVTRKMVYPE